MQAISVLSPLLNALAYKKGRQAGDLWGKGVAGWEADNIFTLEGWIYDGTQALHINVLRWCTIGVAHKWHNLMLEII